MVKSSLQPRRTKDCADWKALFFEAPVYPELQRYLKSSVTDYQVEYQVRDHHRCSHFHCGMNGYLIILVWITGILMVVGRASGIQEEDNGYPLHHHLHQPMEDRKIGYLPGHWRHHQTSVGFGTQEVVDTTVIIVILSSYAKGCLDPCVN